MTICGVSSSAGFDQNSSLTETLIQLTGSAFSPTSLRSVNRRSPKSATQRITTTVWSSTFPNTMASRVEEVRSDELLLELHLEGDAGAFSALVGRYKNELHGFLAKFLGSATAADDVFQETFCKSICLEQHSTKRESLSRGFIRSLQTRLGTFIASVSDG